MKGGGQREEGLDQGVLRVGIRGREEGIRWEEEGIREL